MGSATFKAPGEAGSKVPCLRCHGPCPRSRPRDGPRDPRCPLAWAGWGPPMGLHWVGRTGASTVPHQGPGGTSAAGYLQPEGMRSAQGRSHCPLAQLLGTVSGAAAASSETTPVTVISATSAPARRKISGSHHSHPAGRAQRVRAAPGARRVPASLPRATLHSHVVSMGGSALAQQCRDPSAMASPASKLHLHERGSSGPLQPQPGRRERVPWPAMADMRALFQRCRGWREPGKSDCCQYLSQRGLEELGNCKCLIKGC